MGIAKSWGTPHLSYIERRIAKRRKKCHIVMVCLTFFVPPKKAEIARTMRSNLRSLISVLVSPRMSVTPSRYCHAKRKFLGF